MPDLVLTLSSVDGCLSPPALDSSLWCRSCAPAKRRFFLSISASTGVCYHRCSRVSQFPVGCHLRSCYHVSIWCCEWSSDSVPGKLPRSAFFSDLLNLTSVFFLPLVSCSIRHFCLIFLLRTLTWSGFFLFVSAPRPSR
jgi:hypothetical protein